MRYFSSQSTYTVNTENLKEPEFKLSAFFEITPDLVCIAGKEGFFRKVNQAVIDKLEYTREELMARPISWFIHPEDRHFTAKRREELLNGKALLNFQNRYIAKSGKVIWLTWTSIYLPDEEVVFAIAKDITERKKMELEVEEKYKKFKNLASHFKSSMEEDRKNLASELHEELSQLVSLVKMDVDWINENAYEVYPAARRRIEHAVEVCRLLNKTVRKLSFAISPHLLEHLGLNTALERYCKEFSLLNDIPCSFESAYAGTELSIEVRIDLFRICQEALSNVVSHARASGVKVILEDTGRRVQLSIVDDGKGFVVEHEKHKAGLVRMRERAASVNGQLTIQSEPGKGTSIGVSVPK